MVRDSAAGGGENVSTARECCWKCTERYVGCHSKCPRNAERLAEEAARKAAERADKDARFMVRDYVLRRASRLRKS